MNSTLFEFAKPLLGVGAMGGTRRRGEEGRGPQSGNEGKTQTPAVRMGSNRLIGVRLMQGTGDVSDPSLSNRVSSGGAIRAAKVGFRLAPFHLSF